jgi:hypothetical protein
MPGTGATTGATALVPSDQFAGPADGLPAKAGGRKHHHHH